ncbi:hypothetical protein [Burkholderia anthinoferrum]|uniref:hypothetical protein n=1 Tax=Burkholderia anthinoferrum TaxID=3090833 RepID=UPI0011AFF5B6|nr:hypothetical protein [Burkholderia anthinoferrum]
MSYRFCNKLEKKLFQTPAGFLPMFSVGKKCDSARERRFRSFRACFVRRLNNPDANTKVRHAILVVRPPIVAFCETM